MLTRDDVLIVLDEIESKETDENEKAKAEKFIEQIVLTNNFTLDMLNYINKKQRLNIAKFFEFLRKKHNKTNDKLYMNLVKEQFDSPIDVLVTLSSLNTQILLYSKTLDDDKMFLKHSRADEITSVLHNYYTTYDLIPCLKLIKLIKADLKCFEYLNKN